jgi:hypothetical protein
MAYPGDTIGVRARASTLGTYGCHDLRTFNPTYRRRRGRCILLFHGGRPSIWSPVSSGKAISRTVQTRCGLTLRSYIPSASSRNLPALDLVYCTTLPVEILQHVLVIVSSGKRRARSSSMEENRLRLES